MPRRRNYNDRYPQQHYNNATASYDTYYMPLRRNYINQHGRLYTEYINPSLAHAAQLGLTRAQYQRGIARRRQALRIPAVQNLIGEY